MTFEINNINLLPEIRELERYARGCALLDAILMPEWEYRYFSFDSKWHQVSNEKMASLRDGSGNEFFILFGDMGCVGKVFFDGQRTVSDISVVPESFASFKTEKAFSLQNASLVFWRERTDNEWHISPERSRIFLLSPLLGDSRVYHAWAEEYYERNIDYRAVNHIYTTLEVEKDTVKQLNPEISLNDLEPDLDEILGSSH